MFSWIFVSFFFWFKFSNLVSRLYSYQWSFWLQDLSRRLCTRYMECFSKWSIELSQGYIYMALKIHEFALNTNNLFNLNFQAHEFSRYWNKGNVYITEKKKRYATPFFLSQSPSPPLQICFVMPITKYSTSAWFFIRLLMYSTLYCTCMSTFNLISKTCGLTFQHCWLPCKILPHFKFCYLSSINSYYMCM